MILCYTAGMDLQSLTAIGLTAPQAEAYALLIELGEVKPPDAAKRLKITRTNAYKLLDKLVELKLATKNERQKVFVYTPTNPLALAGLTAQYRAEAVAREEAVNSVMHDLLAKYHQHADQPSVTVSTGRQAVADAYRTQVNLHENIYFIHTKADVASMGFDTMHELRTTPARHGNKRYGILPVDFETHKPNYEPHRRSNLDVTWADLADYDAPVEWSVTKSSLLIVLYATEPHAILIADPVVAGAFMQLWQLLNTLLQQQPLHQKLKPKA